MQGFRPVVVRNCKDVEQSVQNTCDLYALDYHRLTFDILEIHTYKDFAEKDSTLIPATEAHEILENEENYNKKTDFNLHQDFDISIRITEEEDLASFIELSTNTHYNKLYLTLKKGVKIKSLAAFIRHLYEEIQRKKAILGIIVRDVSAFGESCEIRALPDSTDSQVQTDTAEEQIKCASLGQKMFEDLAQKINALNLQDKCENDELQEEITFELERSSAYVPKAGSTLKFLPKEQWEKENNTSLGLASYAVEANQEILRVSYESEGESGRNLKGRYFDYSLPEEESEDDDDDWDSDEKDKAKKQEAPKESKENEQAEQKAPEPKEKIAREIVFDEKLFSKEEKDEYVSYTALQKGYVSVKQGYLKMFESNEFKEVNLRNVGHLLGGVNKDIVVTISGQNPEDDAVGRGMVIEATQIDIMGSVGEKARIIGKEVTIHGQIHQSAFVQCETCNIDFVKGTVIANELRIKNSEMANLDAKNIKIDIATGGQIRAQNLTINKLYSHSKIYFSGTLQIKSVEGGENELYISPDCYYGIRNVVEESNEFIQKCTNKVNKLLQLLNKENENIRKSKPIVAQLKSIIDEKKRLKEPIDKKIKNAMAEYIALVKNAEFLKERIATVQNAAKAKNEELKHIDEELQNAKIITRGSWKRHNEIFYEHIFPKGRDMISFDDAPQRNISIDKENLKLKIE
ncbi:hypothetical protein ACWIWK_09025 [Helicobacter sp. 23-1048]